MASESHLRQGPHTQSCKLRSTAYRHSGTTPKYIMKVTDVFREDTMKRQISEYRIFISIDIDVSVELPRTSVTNTLISVEKSKYSPTCRLVYLSKVYCCNITQYPVPETYLFKINWTVHFAYKINRFFFRRDLPFGWYHICPIHVVPCKFGKDIFNIKDAVLIFQKDQFLRRSEWLNDKQAWMIM